MKRRVLYVILFLLIAAGGYCGWRYYGDVIEPEQKLAAADEQQLELFSQIKPAAPPPAQTQSGEPAATEDAENTETAQTQESPLAPAEEVNAHTTAWLTIPGTHVDYPVVQGEDNDFYLHHGFDGQLNQELGCPFLDFRCEPDFSGYVSIVYAHHMTRQRMFADIALFKDESFMDSHPSGALTLGDGVHTVTFFAYLTVPSNDAVYQTIPASEEAYGDYLEHIREAAVYTRQNFQTENSRLLLLSTCTFEYEEARGVLVGVIG